MAKCDRRSFVVKYGQWVEIYGEDGTLLASFKVLTDMCKEMFTRYLAMRHNVVDKNYKIKKIGGR